MDCLVTMAFGSWWDILGSMWIFCPWMWCVKNIYKMGKSKDWQICHGWMTRSKTAPLVECSWSAMVNAYQKWSKEEKMVNWQNGHGHPRLIDVSDNEGAPTLQLTGCKRQLWGSLFPHSSPHNHMRTYTVYTIHRLKTQLLCNICWDCHNQTQPDNTFEITPAACFTASFAYLPPPPLTQEGGTPMGRIDWNE